MKEIRTQAFVDTEKCTGCATCIHVCPTMAYTRQTQRPVERRKVPPCNANCPIGNDIEGILTLAGEDKWDEAVELLLMTNPLPGVTGRVCNNPCEGACNRGYFDQPVSIRALERALADYAAENCRKIDVSHAKRKEKVAVVGSGPAGLSCACHLARQGFNVTVFEQMPDIGGILRYGIPEYRLPRAVLDREVERLRKTGIDYKVRHKLGENLSMKGLDRYDAVFLAPGFGMHRKLDIPGEECTSVIPGLDFLEQVNKGKAPELSGPVLVVGGGNSAVDSARSLLRLGLKPTLVYRRSEEDMPAIKAEIDDLKSEGIDLVSLTTPVRFILNNGKLTGMECLRMQRGEIGTDGRRQSTPISGSNFTIPAATVIHCLGETRDLKWAPPELKVEDGKIVVDYWGQTSLAKVFAGGDFATGLGTVAHAIGSGKRSAQAIASYLLGETALTLPAEKPKVTASEMNFDYLDPVPRPVSPRLPVDRVISCFEEIHQLSPRDECISETGRCLHCGVIPAFNPEYCRSCTNCSSRCPTYAISLVELEKPYVVKVDIEKTMHEEICRICEKAVIHPESLVCQCTGTRADEIVAAILKGAKTAIDIRRMTGAHTGCSSACISPILRLMKAAGLDVADSPQPDTYYTGLPAIWDVPEHVIRDFNARGFRFKEDKEFFDNWLNYIHAYCGNKKEWEG